MTGLGIERYEEHSLTTTHGINKNCYIGSFFKNMKCNILATHGYFATGISHIVKTPPLNIFHEKTKYLAECSSKRNA